MNGKWLGATALVLLMAGSCPAALAASYDGRPAAADSYADPQDLLDRAAAMSEAIGDTPPDFSIPGPDGEPVWAWQLDDGGLVLADPGDGTTRFVYAAADGEGQPVPFLIRDERQSFAYDGGEPVAMFDDQDRTVDLRDSDGIAREWWEQASELIAEIGQDQAPVAADTWVPYSSSILLFGGWWQHRTWHSDHWRRAPWFVRERQRRQHSRQDWERWRQGGFHGTPPGGDPHRRWVGHGAPGQPGWNRGPAGVGGRPGRPGGYGPGRPPLGATGIAPTPQFNPQATPLPHRPLRPVDPAIVRPDGIKPDGTPGNQPRWPGRNGGGLPGRFNPPGDGQPRFNPPAGSDRPQPRFNPPAGIDRPQPQPRFEPRPQVERPIPQPRFEPRPQVVRPSPPPAQHNPSPPRQQPHGDGTRGHHDD